jgi:pimeloyl-ACP methyl ester carboxylesterase
MTTASLEHEPEPVTSFDGTMIAARAMGFPGRDPDALPLLVVNAVAATLASWRKVLIDVVRGRPAIAWDQRGLLSSGPAASDRLDPGAHAEDAVAVLERHEVERCVLASWSNGSRIALEIMGRYPELVAASVIVSGGYGHPLWRFLRLELASSLPPLAGVAKHFASSLEGPFRALANRPELPGLIRQSGFVGPSADIPALVELLRGVASCDLRVVLATFEAVAGDAATDLLPEVACPTLIVAGDRDPFTPHAMQYEMTERIPMSRLEVYERATHYLPMEFPARLSNDMRSFFEETVTPSA